MAWYDSIRFGVAEILAAGTSLFWRGKLNFLSPLTASDNATLGTTDVGISGFAILAGSAAYDVPRWDTTGDGSWVAEGFASVFAGAVPGSVSGQLLAWSGSAWALSSNVTLYSGGISTYQLKLNNFAGTASNGINLGDGAVIQQNDGGAVIRHVASIDSNGNLDLGPTTGDKVIDCQGNALHDARDARGNATTLPGTGSGTVALKLTGDTTTLTLSNLVNDDKVNSIKFQVRVLNADDSDAWTDVLQFHLHRTDGNIRVSDGANTSNEGATAQLSGISGPDSTYTYVLDLSDTADTIQLSLTDHAVISRIARVTSWWDTAEDVS